MNKRTLFILIRVALLLVFVLGSAVCAIGVPFMVQVDMGLIVPDMPPLTEEETLRLYSQLIFLWVSALPCFVAIIMCWCASGTMMKGKEFSAKVAKMFKTISIMLLIDTLYFLIGNTVFMFLQWNSFALIYYVVAVLGFIISFAFLVISKYVSEAQILKEENDSIL